MTASSWATYAGGAAALIVVLTFIWHRVVRPLAHGCRRFMELLERLFEVLDKWPEIQTSVLSQQGELTTLAIEMGEMHGVHSQIKTDLDNAFDRIRALEPAHPVGSPT